MAKIISGSTVGPILLGTADNPLTITGTVTTTASFTEGIDAPFISATAWTITNDGSVISSGTGDVGILVEASGTATSTVTNAIAAIISATAVGIESDSGTVAVTNAGVITATETEGGHNGIQLESGSVSNAATGSISGEGNGVVFVFGAGGTVTNSGSITGTLGDGILLGDVGSVDNFASASISGGLYGIEVDSLGTVTNAGGIIGATDGINFFSGGSLGNSSGASISGGTGVFITGGAVTVTNDGTITGAIDKGIEFSGAGGSVANAAGASISGTHFGILFEAGVGAGTVTNDGTISGGTYAVLFADAFPGGGPNLLVVDPAAVFIGAVVGGEIGSNALELAGGSGTISGLTGGSGTVTESGPSWSFTSFETITIDAGGTWTFAGGNTVASGNTLVNDGATTLASGATLDIEGSLGTAATTTFDLGGTGTQTLILGATASGGAGGSFAPTITDWGFGDKVEIGGITAATPVAVYDSVDHTLTIESGISIEYTLKDVVPVAGVSSFMAGTDPSTGDLFVEPLCFLSGTAIATPEGDVPVERLAVGDRVLTASGQVKPIRWIGRGTYLAAVGSQGGNCPIIVRAGALADGVPQRDLRVTKGLSLYLDGVLIPVEFLINHRSILWDDRPQIIEVFHIELADHDILLADGAPAESYRDDGNRVLFQNANPAWDTRPEMPPFAPILSEGPVVDGIWWRLLERVGVGGLDVTDDADLHLLADGKRVDPEAAEGPVYRFRLACPPTELRIASRSTIPAAMGLVRDLRTLGVALRRVGLAEAGAALSIGYDSAWLAEGFNDPEPAAGFRWTTGEGRLRRRALAAFEGPLTVELEVGCTAHYPRRGLPVLLSTLAGAAARELELAA